MFPVLGCRAGNDCPYAHTKHDVWPPETRIHEDNTASDHGQKAVTNVAKDETPRHLQAPAVARSRVVSRPVPKTQTEDPREFQLGQIRRRFSPKEDESTEDVSLTFRMVPSDPDFPYDIESLACVLSVPKTYPQSGKPALRILNQEMPRGFQLNVEQGFGDIAASAPNATLLGLMNRLDKDLAGLLSRPRAQTIKLYRNTNIAGSTTYAPSGPEDSLRTATVATTQKQSTSAPTHTFTSEQKIRAQSKRQADIRQLVARLGRLPAFNQAADGVTFTVPFTPPRKAGLPATLRNLSSVRLIVPELYNLEPCRVEFPGIKDQSATNVEQAFETRVRSDIEATLLTHINYMSQHLLAVSYTHLTLPTIYSV